MKVRGIDHVHLAVNELEQAKKFCERALGITFCPPANVRDDDLGNDIAQASLMSPSGLEVIAPSSEGSSIRRFIDKRGEGLHAVSFRVDDIEAAIEHLQREGLRLVGRIAIGKAKEAQFHPKDSFGFMIELIEYPDRCGAHDASLDRD